MKRLTILAAALLFAACSAPTPAIGTPFVANGRTVTVWGLTRVADLQSVPRSQPVHQLWVMDVEMANGIGSDVRTGFRIEDADGVTQTATLVNNAGGHANLMFELAADAAPASIVVDDQGETVRLALAN